MDNTLYNAKANANVEMNFYIEGLQKDYGAYKAEWSTAPTIFNSYAFNKTGFSDTVFIIGPGIYTGLS